MSPLLESEWAYECIGQKIIAEMMLKWLPELDHKSCAPYYRFSCNTYCLDASSRGICSGNPTAILLGLSGHMEVFLSAVPV